MAYLKATSFWLLKSMKLFKDWGEDKFVQYIQSQFPRSGIGDDCAVIPPWVITTDALVEGIHFIKEQIPAYELGYKAVAVNVSDIAAMGGTPLYAFLSIALPSSTPVVWAKELVRGIKEGCEKWHIQLRGGDTVGSKKDLFLNITLLGSATKVKYRDLAEEGDIIYVTGPLGDSAAGLRALQNHRSTPLIQAHFHPEPSIEKGVYLASQDAVHAMMDLSDGLDVDLKRMLKASQKGAMIETTHIPFSHALKDICAHEGWEPLELALTGGEDYCLLLTASKELKAPFPLYPIGAIIDNPRRLIYLKKGKEIKIPYQSFDQWLF